MPSKITTYTVREDKVAQIEQAIEDFVKAIAENEPQTYYAAYRTNDENAYFHIMRFPDPETEARHQKAPYTLEFVEVLYPNCTVEPKFTDLELIEST
jgi:quinol monooxygenase YgiN